MGCCSMAILFGIFGIVLRGRFNVWKRCSWIILFATEEGSFGNLVFLLPGCGAAGLRGIVKFPWVEWSGMFFGIQLDLILLCWCLPIRFFLNYQLNFIYLFIFIGVVFCKWTEVCFVLELAFLYPLVYPFTYLNESMIS